MCTPQTTELVYALQAQANELDKAEQREATIAAALALPEAERYRLWRLLDEQFSPHAERNLRELEERRKTYERARRMEELQRVAAGAPSRHHINDEANAQWEIDNIAIIE